MSISSAHNVNFFWRVLFSDSLLWYIILSIKVGREAFPQLTEIRSLMPSDRGMMALTATATRALRLQVEQMLEMRSPLAITHSPDKQNLKLSATKLKGFNNRVS